MSGGNNVGFLDWAASYARDVYNFYGNCFREANQTFYNSDVGAMLRGDFKRAWEINRDCYVRPLSQGKVKEAAKIYGQVMLH
ncbi:hypothetical protein IJS77_02010 [bacterium]|nr:hypothetical protein [bacterium]